MSPPRRTAGRIDILVEAAGWRRMRGAAAIVRRAAEAALATKRSVRNPELCIMLADNRAVRRLNRDWRGQDKPTNVLSFPSGMHAPLGDIAIAYGVVTAEARTQGKTPRDHLAHLVVHGVLHLLGYDHEVDRDADRMERLEVRILKGLGVADPYRGERGA